jgi:hypothetical protein
VPKLPHATKDRRLRRETIGCPLFRSGEARGSGAAIQRFAGIFNPFVLRNGSVSKHEQPRAFTPFDGAQDRLRDGL